MILTALWSFILGILGTTLLSIPPLVCVLIIIVALAIYYAEKHVFIFVTLTFFALGAFRYDIKDFHILEPAGNTGIVVSEPERRDADTRFVVRTETGEKVLVSTDIFAEVEYGDEVKLVGTAKVLKPGGYAEYLAKDDIFYTLDRAKVEVLSRGNGHPLTHALLAVKGAFTERVRRILPEPESSLLSGLIVSGKQALPAEVLEEFRRSGIVHIVVLSGFNITIIAVFLAEAFGFLGRRRAAMVAAGGVALFVLMSGAPATVLRGAIMVLLLMFGRIWGREGSAPRILLFTACLMLMWNPKSLVYDASFQLSFLAMLGLIYAAPAIQRFAERLVPAWLATMLSATLGTQALVFPFILYNMGNFSTVFLLSNLLVLVVIPVTMLVGFVAALVAFASNALAWPLAFVAHILLAWILFVADFLGNFSFALIEIEGFPLWGSLLIYIALGVSLWRLRIFLPRSSS